MIQQTKESKLEAMARVEAEYEAREAERRAEKDKEWGPEVVPGVRIKHEPEMHSCDENDVEIPGSRGHYHVLEFHSPSFKDGGDVFMLSGSVDDRDGPVKREVAKFLREAARELEEAAEQLEDLEEHGTWLVVLFDLDRDAHTPGEIIAVKDTEGAAVNMAIGVNSCTEESGKYAEVVRYKPEAEPAERVVKRDPVTFPTHCPCGKNADGTDRQELAKAMTALTTLVRVEDRGSWHGVHLGTFDGHRYQCTLDFEAEHREFQEFNVSDFDQPLNEAIAERLDRYAAYFQQMAKVFRDWQPEAESEVTA